MKNEGNKENEFSVLSMDSLTSFADSTDDWIPHRRSRRGDESNESYELPEIETPNKNGPHSCVPEPIDTPFISKLANFHVSSKEDIRQNNKSPGLEVSTDSNKLMTNRRDAGFKNSTSSVNNASKNSTKETIEVKDGQKDKEIDEKENKKDQNTARENVVEEIVSKSATKIPLSPILTSETSGQLSLETEVESTVQNQNTSELESKVTYPTTSTTTNRDTTASVSTTTINSENNAVLNDSNFRDASSLQFRETVSDALGINNKSNANELSDENDYIKHSNKISSSQQKDPQRNQYSNINYDYQHQHNQVQKLQPSTTSQDKLLARNFPSQEGDNPFLDAGIPLPSPLDPVGQDKSTFSPLSPLSPSIMTKASNSFNRSENDLSKSNNGKPFYFYNDEDRESIATTKEPSSVQETITIGVREEKTQVDMLKSTIFALQVKLHILENTKNGSLPTNVIDLQKQLAEERAWRLTAQNEVKRLNDALSKLRNQTKQREGEDQERLLMMSKQQQMMQMADNNDMQEFVNQYNDALEELADVHNQLLDTREQLEQTQQENILLNQTLQESTKITDNAAVEDLLHKLNLENDSLRRSLDDGEPKFSSVLTKKRTLLLDTLRDTADLLDCDLDDHFDLDDVGYCPECGSEDINIVFEVARIIQKAVVIRIREYDELAQDNEALNDEKFALDRQIRTLYRNLNHANSKKQEAVNLTKVVTERCEQLQQKMDELNKNASNFKNGMEVLDTILEVVRQFYQSKIDVSNISEVCLFLVNSNKNSINLFFLSIFHFLTSI